MIYKTLYSGEKIPVIWQGASRVTQADIQTQVDIFKVGIKYGLNVIDTAESYSGGKSEIIIGELLKSINRNDIFISSKISPENAGYDNVFVALDGSLKRLNTDYIDLYQLHWNNPLISIEETLYALLELQEKGKIKYIGVSNFTLYNIKKYFKLLGGKLASVQMEYNLINRTCEDEIIPFCQKNNIIFSAWGSLTQGDFNFDIDTINLIAKKYNKTIQQIILNWITRHENVIAITKSSNPDHIISNSKSLDFIIDSDDIDLINNSYECNIIKIKPKEIDCLSTGGNEEGNHPAYKTIEEAIENRFGFYPSPFELSKELEVTNELPYPVYLKCIDNKFKLVGGNSRYWAWVLAFGFEKEIKCILLKNRNKL